MNLSFEAPRVMLIVVLGAAAVGGCDSEGAQERDGSSPTSASNDAVAVPATIASVSTSIPSASLLDVVIVDPDFGGLPATLAPELAQLPELMAVSPIRYAHAVVDDAAVQIVACDPSTFGLLFDLGVVEGAVEDLAGGGVMLQESRARELGLGVGDVVGVTWRNGESQQLEVVGMFADSPLGAWLTSIEVLTIASDDPPLDVTIVARLEDGVSEDDGRAAVAAVLDRYPNAAAQWQSDFEFRPVEPDS